MHSRVCIVLLSSSVLVLSVHVVFIQSRGMSRPLEGGKDDDFPARVCPFVEAKIGPSVDYIHNRILCPRQKCEYHNRGYVYNDVAHLHRYIYDLEVSKSPC
ncbi:hypothetical protein BDN67DRAFT_734425 [Paxillus ammoniavirescens]|nr:hypothetical protein BDN67DRAFT_734425 [Paxillus ammoniavirescens]